MATTVIDGITTRYEVVGSGAPLLMFSPGGFDATLEKWKTQSIYAQIKPLEGVVSPVTAEGKTFNQDPRGGPWASVIRRDPAFAQSYARQDAERYKRLVTATVETLFDRDTAPGAEPEDLLRLDIPALVVPGRDKSHATSAARYLEECLPRSEYWDVAVADQTDKTAPARILEFLNNRT